MHANSKHPTPRRAREMYKLEAAVADRRYRDQTRTLPDSSSSWLIGEISDNMVHVPELESLKIGNLLEKYRSGSLRPLDVTDDIYQRISSGADHVWIGLVPATEARARANALASQSPDLPLYGVPFAVKDNIDVDGMQTTAGCLDFAYIPASTAPLVQRLLDAGAMLIGKTNMDQFATGLAGVRSPFGVPRNPFDERYIPGGSSSGSAVAVATGLASFALGTDTAGSGRVPAAFCNIVGFKPTRGWLSTRGTVPACRTLDCISVMALTCADVAAVAQVAGAFDPEDPFSRPAPHPFLPRDFCVSPSRPWGRRTLHALAVGEPILTACSPVPIGGIH